MKYLERGNKKIRVGNDAIKEDWEWDVVVTRIKSYSRGLAI